jgi:hypothetical protein
LNIGDPPHQSLPYNGPPYWQPQPFTQPFTQPLPAPDAHVLANAVNRLAAALEKFNERK